MDLTHQAMTEIEDNNADTGTICKKYKGYIKQYERLFRPALVGVSKMRSKISKIKKKDKQSCRWEKTPI